MSMFTTAAKRTAGFLTAGLILASLATGSASASARPVSAPGSPSYLCPTLPGWSVGKGTLQGNVEYGFTFDCFYTVTQGAFSYQADVTVSWLDKAVPNPEGKGCGVLPQVQAAVRRTSDLFHVEGWATTQLDVPTLASAVDSLMGQVQGSAAPCTSPDADAVPTETMVLTLTPKSARAKAGRPIALSLKVTPVPAAGMIVRLQFYRNGNWTRQGDLPLTTAGTWTGTVRADKPTTLRFRAVVLDANGSTVNVSGVSRLTWTRR